MRPSLLLGIAALLAAVSLRTPAKADGNNFDVTVSNGQITVMPHSGWRINIFYGWKVKQGDTTVKDKRDFKLSTASASVGGLAAGSYTVKGALYVADDSHVQSAPPFEVAVTVQ